jgi:alkyl sulfatase BDS1-like metallo-beta-lactamase superfamily hydrolase
LIPIKSSVGPSESACALTQPIEEFEVDGVRMIFQNTPNTEAPREMNTYFPDMKARFIPKGELGFIFLCLYDAVRSWINA